MNDEQMQPLLDGWLRDRETPRPEVRPGIAKVMADVPRTRQQGRWWPLPAFDRPRSTSPMAARGFTMFSALRFLVAGAIVALFGGFLLTGILSTQQGEEVAPAAVIASPTPAFTSEPTEVRTKSVRSDILAGVPLTVEAIEPGVYRVLRDDMRRLSPFKGWALTAGMDGSIWGIRDWRFFQVGGRGYDAPVGREYGPSMIAPDGTAWDWHEGEIVSFDGKRWKVRKRAEGDAMDLALDGTIWATLPDPQQPNRVYLHRFTGKGWQRTDIRVPKGTWLLRVNDESDIWAVIWLRDEDGEWLHHLIDGEWQRLGPRVASVDVGPDGTVWLMREPEPRIVQGGEPGNWADLVTDADGNVVFDYVDTLMRFDGTEWQEWDAATGVPSGFGGVTIGADGSVWGTLGQETCQGVHRFDGTAWTRYLPGLCINQFQVAPDGSVWILAGTGGDMDEGNWYDLYVITPKAVAATE